MQSTSSVTSRAFVGPSFFLRAASPFAGRTINFKPCQPNITTLCNIPNAFLIHKRTSWSFNHDSQTSIWRMHTCTRIDESLYDVSFDSFAAYVQDVAKNEVKGSQYFDLRDSKVKACYSDGKIYKLKFLGQNSLNDSDIPKLIRAFPYLAHLEIENCDLAIESAAKLLTKGMQYLEINKSRRIASEKFKEASIV